MKNQLEPGRPGFMPVRVGNRTRLAMVDAEGRAFWMMRSGRIRDDAVIEQLRAAQERAKPKEERLIVTPDEAGLIQRPR